MEIIQFIRSVNKISIVAFLITLAGLIYEVKLLKKEKLLQSKPNIPQFDEKAAVITATPPIVLVTQKKERVTKPNNTIIIVLIILLIFFGVLIGFGFTSSSQTTLSKISPSPVINFITSGGIKIFDQNFNLITDDQLNKIQAGDWIIIGVETVTGSDIDRARIRVNKNSWSSDDITLDYSQSHRIYFIKYQVATGESKLKIEAQLHSSSDGWLGE